MDRNGRICVGIMTQQPPSPLSPISALITMRINGRLLASSHYPDTGHPSSRSSHSPHRHKKSPEPAPFAVLVLVLALVSIFVPQLPVLTLMLMVALYRMAMLPEGVTFCSIIMSICSATLHPSAVGILSVALMMLIMLLQMLPDEG